MTALPGRAAARNDAAQIRDLQMKRETTAYAAGLSPNTCSAKTG